MVIFSCILVFKQEKVHNTTPIYPHFIFHKGGSIFNHAERTEMHDETTLQKLGLNKISTKKEIFSTQKEFFSTEKEISRPRHLTRAGLYLQGLLAQFHCSMKLNLILTCVTSYQFLFRAPWPVLTGNLTIGYMGPTAVPVWLLPLQLQMSSVENVSYYLYTCYT